MPTRLRQNFAAAGSYQPMRSLIQRSGPLGRSSCSNFITCKRPLSPYRSWASRDEPLRPEVLKMDILASLHQELSDGERLAAHVVKMNRM